MHRLCILTLSLSLACLSFVSGRLHAYRKGTGPKVPAVDTGETPVVSRNGTVLPPYTTIYFFDQLIDHNNPSLGTFKQRYFHTYEFYEPGGPIILFTPGEINIDLYAAGYLNISTITGLIAQQQSGSIIVLEHRFYGLSNPYPDLSVKSLQVHTIQQAIDDFEYFAKNVKLPMPDGDQVNPDKAPWILAGGSYSGALASWTMFKWVSLSFVLKKQNGYASSAVVEAVVDYWQYFEIIRKNMPANCSADVQAVIAHVDKTFTGTNASAIQALKESFHMGNITHLDDVAAALQYNLFDWQSLDVTSGPGAQFFNFCDALEVKDGVNAPATGWGLDHALDAWGSYWRDFYFEYSCGSYGEVDCLGTYDLNLAYWTNTSVDNAHRSFLWVTCNELGFFLVSPPPFRPTLVSRFVQPAYGTRQCRQMFPGAFTSSSTPQATLTNIKYGGRIAVVPHLFIANGRRDPYRDATLSADGFLSISTPLRPIAVSNGFHCSDMLTSRGIADPTVAAVQAKALASMKDWLKTWKPATPSPSDFS